MTQLITLVLFFSFPIFVVLVRNIFSETYLWQIKEYRIDRVISHFKYEKSKSTRNRIINIIQFALLFSAGLFLLRPINALLLVPLMVFASYSIETLIVIENLFRKTLELPKKSIRNILITAFSFLLLILPLLLVLNFIINIYNQYELEPELGQQETIEVTFQDFLVQEDAADSENVKAIPLAIAVLFLSSFVGLAADLGSPLAVSAMAIATEPLSQFKRARTISAAKHKVKQTKKLKIIAITGSYGKTTTKEILYELIKDEFITAKTDENFNSTVGIAESMLRNLKKDTEIFIAEMGAYKKGEIKKSTQLAKPDISIITAIGPQHISLFGNMKNLFQAKYEIVENLKKKGLAILNGNDQYCVQMAGKTDKRTLMYHIIDDKRAKINNTIHVETDNKKFPAPTKDNLYAVNIKVSPKSIAFKLLYNRRTYLLDINIIGSHNISNILASIGAALELGMTPAKIVGKLKSMELPHVRLRWFDGVNNTKVLDDSYNTNPEGFKAALETVKKEKKKKIIITRGIIELGNMQTEVYKDLAKEISKSVNIVLSSDQKLLDAIDANTKKVITEYVQTDRQIYSYLINEAGEGDVILLEGRLSPGLVDKIIDTN